MKNLKAIKKILEHIEKNPKQWNQKHWHTKDTHSFAGWAEIWAMNKRHYTRKTEQNARLFLGFSQREADYYFDPFRTLDELKTALEPFFDQNGMGRDGYDRDGYSRLGYNKQGRDRDGFDRYGYDRWGYDREGYDQDGYDRDGFNRNGYDRDGYDRDGYNCHGYDREGYDRDGYDRYRLNRNNEIKPLKRKKNENQLQKTV